MSAAVAKSDVSSSDTLMESSKLRAELLRAVVESPLILDALAPLTQPYSVIELSRIRSAAASSGTPPAR
jgi:hypothetical protein